MTELERLNQQLAQLPSEQRQAWAARFCRELEQGQDTDPVLASLTPEERERLNAKLQEGLDQLDRGEGRPWDYDAWLAECRERNAAGRR